ncbi:hypothetical protein HF521_014917 [Silurus meridionalis]|uniref:MHC class I-like antigen recognition-like domain-containing protein n=2 Tax=Silurus meridionalis TaxID=175797 RepID=A0A8T0A8W9_SILME|nr:hypothetical protein HF521_014917 [Silurus meridionalis]
MEDASGKIFNVLLFLTISVQLSLAERHSLQYLYTSITAGINFPNFTAVGLVDGEQFMYYDSNISKAVPKTEWINTCKAFTPDFWTTETQKHQNEQRDCQNLMTALMQRPNKPDGDHTLQVIHSCTLNDDMSTFESKFGYDGENVQNDDNWLTEGIQ